MLEAVTFSRIGYADNFTLVIDDVTEMGGNVIAGGDYESGSLLWDNAVYYYTITNAPAGQFFQFSVRDWNDDYMITALEFSTASGGGGSGGSGGAIPEPNAAVLFGAGLIIAGVHRRNKAAA